MPIYTDFFKDVVRYPSLEKEVKIGNYYVRLWNREVKIKNMVKEKDEKKFYVDLKDQLKKCVQNEEMKQKVIILIHAARLALKL